jgi:hypothetical protein
MSSAMEPGATEVQQSLSIESDIIRRPVSCTILRRVADREVAVAKNDRKPWTREDVKVLREQARDRNVSTDEIAKNLGRTVAGVRAGLSARTPR